MAFSRAAALRSCFRGARSSFARPQFARQVGRRAYASGGHEHAKAGGDALWAAGAVAVTIPSCWWILSKDSASDHHGGHGDAHGKEHSEEHEEEPKQEEEEEEEEGEKSDDVEEKSDDDSGKSDDSESDEKEADTPETSDDESVEKGDEANEGDKDKAAAAKPVAKGRQSGKQEGLSNADTKHSTDLGNDPEESKKGEGMPETAKSKGTVDPKRPQK